MQPYKVHLLGCLESPVNRGCVLSHTVLGVLSEKAGLDIRGSFSLAPRELQHLPLLLDQKSSP